MMKGNFIFLSRSVGVLQSSQPARAYALTLKRKDPPGSSHLWHTLPEAPLISPVASVRYRSPKPAHSRPPLIPHLCHTGAPFSVPPTARPNFQKPGAPAKSSIGYPHLTAATFQSSTDFFLSRNRPPYRPQPADLTTTIKGAHPRSCYPKPGKNPLELYQTR